MLDVLGRILAWWVGREPSASLIMFVAAVLLFAGVFTSANNKFNGYMSGLERFVHALGYAVLFVGILGGFYFLLNTSLNVFQPLAIDLASGREQLEQTNKAREMWGGEIVQNEMTIRFTHSFQETVDYLDADNKPLYVTRTITQPVEQEGIENFDGQVVMDVTDLALTTFVADAHYQYSVVNQSEYTTTAEFEFPIVKNRYYENVSVLVNGVDHEYDLRSSALVWEVEMSPHQVESVEISYSVRGMREFTYYVAERRGIKDFLLSVDVNTPRFATITLPGGDAIQLESKHSGKSYQAIWKLDRAIMTPQLGINLRSTNQYDVQQDQAIRIAGYAPAALMLLGVTALMTMLITGVQVHIGRLLLYLGVFSAQFLGMMGLDLLKVNYIFLMALFFLPVFGLTFLIFKELPRLPRALLLFLTFIFSVGYPPGNLLPDVQARNTFGMIVQALILLYIFGLTLYVRVRRKNTLERVE